MGALENVFSWSKSRDEQFRECPRQYYYDKYASWGGWDKKSAPQTRLAYVLKNLKNRWAWKGESVHHVIEHALKALRRGTPLTPAATEELLTQLMREGYRSSKAKKYFDDPKNNTGLFEHEYVKPVTDDTWKKIHDEAVQCVRNFFESPLYKELASEDKGSWLVIEELEDFQYDGAKVYVKLDFAKKRGDVVEIYDWKTGKAEGDVNSVQMGVYTLYAMKKWDVGMDRIRTRFLYLSEKAPEPLDQPVTEETLSKTRSFMSESIRGMRELLQDPAKNIPKPVECFAYTSNTRMCSNCNFLKLCDNPALSKS